jgi:carbohydrate-binding DOMON domain-containing protein
MGAGYSLGLLWIFVENGTLKGMRKSKLAPYVNIDATGVPHLFVCRRHEYEAMFFDRKILVNSWALPLPPNNHTIWIGVTSYVVPPANYLRLAGEKQATVR